MKQTVTSNHKPNSATVESETQSMNNAILTGNYPLFVVLYEKGVQLDANYRERIISRGHVNILKYLQAKGVTFKNSSDTMDQAWSSGNLEMVKYVIDELHCKPFPDNMSEKNSSYYHAQIINKVMKSGGIATLEFIEKELKIPVEQILTEELKKKEYYHHVSSGGFILEAVCSDKVAFLKYLFETRGFKPNVRQLRSLEGYAYNHGSGTPQHQKFVTHAYVYSLFHPDPYMAKLLLDVSNMVDLATLNTSDLFRLFADYSMHYPETASRMRYQTFFRENSVYLAAEIAMRHVEVDVLIAELFSDQKLANDVFFYFLSLGKGYTESEVHQLLNSKTFNPNADFFEGNRALHLVIYYHRTNLIPLLLALGAEPSTANNKKQTPINNLGNSDSKFLQSMLEASKNISDTFHQAMKEGDVSLLVSLLKNCEGIPKVENVLQWVQNGRDFPLVLHTVLCELNTGLYEQLKLDAGTANDAVILEIIGFVDHFKQEGERHETMTQLEYLEACNRAYSQMRGGFSGFTELNLFQLKHGKGKMEYPDFLKRNNIAPEDLTAEKVAEAFNSLQVGPIGLGVTKGIFTLWAQGSNLSFDLDAVEAAVQNFKPM